nr:MAG TPA: hypothetical protein [Caudoviricetes sp.]
MTTKSNKTLLGAPRRAASVVGFDSPGASIFFGRLLDSTAGRLTAGQTSTGFTVSMLVAIYYTNISTIVPGLSPSVSSVILLSASFTCCGGVGLLGSVVLCSPAALRVASAVGCLCVSLRC